MNLIVYASMAKVLAEEQLAGRLRIAPHPVMCSSEVLTEDAVSRSDCAWGSRPFNVYAAAETAGLASDCPTGLSRAAFLEFLAIHLGYPL